MTETIIAATSELPEYDGIDAGLASTMPEVPAYRTLASTVTKHSPTEKQKLRTALADYCAQCEKNRAGIHYSQARPYHGLGVEPAHGFTADCSSYVTLACFWAGHETGIDFADPNGLNYSGWGFTGTLLHNNLHHPVPPDHDYLIGDLAIYGPAWATRHVVICRERGTATTSVWSSHGSEAGPLPVRALYRTDLLGVFRPAALL